MISTELRLGNLLDFEGETCIVREIDSSGVVVLFDNCEEEWIDLFQLTPIPLNKEYILDFGFVEDDGEYSLEGLHLEDRREDHYSKNINVEDFGVWLVNSYLKEIKYVHELQNIYSILKNKELKRKKEL